MEYAALVDVYDRLGATASNHDKRDVLAGTFVDAGDMLPRLVTLVRGRLGPAYDRPELGVSSSLTMDAILRATGAPEAAVRERWKETGDLGDAAAWAAEHGGQQTLFSEDLTVERVHDRLRELATFEGEGSQDRKVDALAGLIADADPDEARYVVRTALSHMRVGVGEGTIRDAVAHAFLDGSEEAIAAVERAFQVTTDFRVVAETAREEGRAGLAALDVELGRPVGSMLAEKAESLEEALADAAAPVEDDASEGASGAPDADTDPDADASDGTPDADTDPDADASDDAPSADAPDGDDTDEAAPAGRARCEVKYDGIRVQVHVDRTGDGPAVRLFTRRLEEVTEQFPDVVRAVEEGVTAERALLDGELVGYTPETVAGPSDERDPVAFQELSRRVKREEDVAAMAREVPAVVHPFDCLYSGEAGTLVGDPLAERLEHLAGAFEPVDPRPEEGVAGLEAPAATWAGPDDPGPAEELYHRALEGGHEGLVVKNPAAAYEPGRRVGRLLKVKPTMEPLDLAVTRAVYSEGRRSEMLGRLYLACYDADAEELREIGRLSTGYTDEELAALTERLEGLITARDGREVGLRAEVVLEVEYEELQESPEYGSGYALRFPRFLSVREDLGPEDADTLDRVESLYDAQ